MAPRSGLVVTGAYTPLDWRSMIISTMRTFEASITASFFTAMLMRKKLLAVVEKPSSVFIATRCG